MNRIARVGSATFGEGHPLGLIAGPCGLESRELALRVASALAALCAEHGVPYVFKGSFDKANRTSGQSWRGPGLDAGLAILAEVRATVGCPVTTDVHLPEQAATAAEVVDLLQIPAFLCRQTDLLVACAATGLPVNVKKGQFVAPWDLRGAVEKLRGAGASDVLVTERGTTFGYNDLVVDLRAIPELGKLGVPVVFDATHSVQKPGGGGDRTTATREHVDPLARAAIAAGADLVFAEVHPDPASARSDADSQLPLDAFPALFRRWLAIARVVRAPDAVHSPP